MLTDNLESRSEILVEVFEDYVDKNAKILEIGSGDGRNIKYLKEAGYKKIEGIDKLFGSAIEDVSEKKYDVIFTMSTLFLIPKENEWVFEKIARMARKMIITFEGETTWKDAFNPDGTGVIGRNYEEIFTPFGFKQIEIVKPIFNIYGVMRVLKRIWI